MIRIESSAGVIFCDDSGVPYSPLPDEYNNIVQFDIRRLERMCISNHIPFPKDEGWDILALGYWLEDGSYEDPTPSYAEGGVMRHIWTGHVEDLDEAIELGGEW